MKKITTILLLILGLNLFSQNIPNPSKELYVTDLANILSDSEERSIDATIRSYKEKTTTEFAVLTVSSLDDHDIETYANETFKKWGIGTKTHNNGLLILVAPNQRKMRVEVGYGLEAYLTDSYTKDKSTELATPNFKKQQYFTGINNLVLDFQKKLGYLPFSKFLEIQATVDKNQKVALDALNRKLEEQYRQEKIESDQRLYGNLIICGIVLLILLVFSSIFYLIYTYNKRKHIIAVIKSALSDNKLTNYQSVVNTLFSYKADISQEDLPTLLSDLVSLKVKDLKKTKYDDLFTHYNTCSDMTDKLTKEIELCNANKERFEKNLVTLSKLIIPASIVNAIDSLSKVTDDIEFNIPSKSYDDLKEFEQLIKATTPKSLKDSDKLIRTYENLIAKVKSDISKCESNKSYWSTIRNKTKGWESIKTDLASKLDVFSVSFNKVRTDWGKLSDKHLVDFKKDEFINMTSKVESLLSKVNNKTSLKSLITTLSYIDDTIANINNRLSNPKNVDITLRNDLFNATKSLENLKTKCKDALSISKNSDVSSTNRSRSINYVNTLSSLVGLTGLAILVNKNMISESESQLSNHIRSMKSDISEAEDERRRERERREEEERRRRREEAAAAAALIAAASYSSSSSSSSSYSSGSSWGGGSSFGGGSSGGGGSTSDW